MKLCKSHVTQLRKVATQLAYKQTMNYNTLILSLENNDKVKEAEQLIYKAIRLLDTVE